MQNVISEDRYQQVVELLKSGDLAYAVVAERSGVFIKTVVRIADGTHYHQTGKLALDERPKGQLVGRRTPGKMGYRGIYLPTPEEITELCTQIRETWDEDRLGGWTPPVFSKADLLCT